MSVPSSLRLPAPVNQGVRLFVMLHESHTFNAKALLPESWRTDSFHYCKFELITDLSESLEGCYLGTEFEACHWYWGHFNCSTFVSCTFKNCRFNGTSFSSCKFVECTFENCDFGIDNMGQHCSFEDCRWYGCTQLNCNGMPAL